MHWARIMQILHACGLVGREKLLSDMNSFVFDVLCGRWINGTTDYNK